ncbi:MAG TPA: SDR family oxidoreductase [Bacteroidia bacterium]|jgi:NAD(P)-dependent dehydrogenase (short-subunit alcohol dehydrogenase family)|nr:SDR family oxidoreductase [Bacteroidia bacterium]HQK97908.1 SDR family oxidoreductase [Bacteroidia bacterium]
MKKTIVITGASSGIGKSIALLFAAKGWNVAATMRNPSKTNDFQSIPSIKTYALDVTSESSIQSAFASIMNDFSRIDVVVNNAGYGATGIFEKSTDEQVRLQFDTNVFGLMNVTREALRYFRNAKNGTIINITSMGGLITFPFYSVYHGTKWAVEGFSESLAFELRHLNIKVKCVEPGAIKTDFYDRSMDLFKNPSITDYDRYEEVVYKNTQQAGQNAPGPEVVALTVYKAATDNSNKLRYPVGGLSPILLMLRKLLPLSWFTKIVTSQVEKGFKS